jgi:hypothetical protein
MDNIVRRNYGCSIALPIRTKHTLPRVLIAFGSDRSGKPGTPTQHSILFTSRDTGEQVLAQDDFLKRRLQCT